MDTHARLTSALRPCAVGTRRIYHERDLPMATRLQRLAEFDGNGEPSPDEVVQVLCEDKSGTYELPFACRRINGKWRNNESGNLVEAMVVGWRRPRT